MKHGKIILFLGFALIATAGAYAQGTGLGSRDRKISELNAYIKAFRPDSGIDYKQFLRLVPVIYEEKGGKEAAVLIKKYAETINREWLGTGYFLNPLTPAIEKNDFPFLKALLKIEPSFPYMIPVYDGTARPDINMLVICLDKNNLEMLRYFESDNAKLRSYFKKKVWADVTTPDGMNLYLNIFEYAHTPDVRKFLLKLGLSYELSLNRFQAQCVDYGVPIRKEPFLDSPVLGNMDRSDFIVVIAYSGFDQKISEESEKSYRWIKIKAGAITGWCYDENFNILSQQYEK